MTNRMGPIIVINPNSTESVTRGMDEAVTPLRVPDGPVIECVTLRDGPPGIESQADVDAVVEPICALVSDRQAEAGAFVIGCYSDPGLQEARRIGNTPVFGIAESAMLQALAVGRTFGVISILEGSVARHLRYVRALGLESRAAGDRAVGLGVTELEDDPGAFARILAVGEALRDEDGADVVILGCAGMARHQRSLENVLGVPVVEPTRAATGLALTTLLVSGS
jgi:Asp/Glu/hydantoin racemase